MSRTVDRQRGNPDEIGAPDGTALGTGATLTLQPDGDRELVREWLEKRGLRAVPMGHGFQVVGDSDALNAALGPVANGAIPSELASHVQSVVPAQRKYIHT